MAGSPQRLRAALALSVAGAVTVLIDLLGPAGDLAGSAAIVGGAMLAWPARSAPGAAEIRWWPALLAGAILAAVGGPISFAGATTAGGLLAGAGGVLAIVAAALGFPERD